MIANQDQIDALVETLYEAALAPDRWESVLAETGRLIGATAAGMIWADGPGLNIRRMELWNMDPAVMPTFERDYITVCPRIRMSRDMRTGEVYDDALARRSATGAVRDYYDFLDHHAIGQARILVAERNPDLRAGLVFYRPIGRNGAPEQEDRILRELASHTRRASHLTMKAGAIAEGVGLGDALFEMGEAMLVVNASRRVHRMNEHAEDIVRHRDGLVLLKGCLHAATPSDEARLDLEIELSQRGGDPASDHDGFVLIGRPSGRPAWAVSVTPLPLSLGGGTKRSRRLLVHVVETSPQIRPDSLRRGLGLSESESRIAASLAGGMRLEQIAEARGVSLLTVRSQLKAIFAKLEVSTQAQLVGRVSACSRAWPVSRRRA